MRIPIIGNGDIKTPERAKECFDKYGVDAVMIGRGALGNPEIFATLREKEVKESKLDLIHKHYDMLLQIFNEEFVVKHMRKHVLWYLKGCRNAAEYKKEIVKFETVQEVYDYLDQNKENLWEK